MSTEPQGVEADRQLIREAHAKGPAATALTYAKLSGPGWLQSAITLGGGSLSSSLYLGVLAGFSLLWLQPFAMILGIVMLSAIGYVTLSTGERPFRAINRHVNPVLGWGWALATLAANMVWVLPQYSLANGVLEQNLIPQLFGSEPVANDMSTRIGIAIVILVVTTAITWAYDSGSRGIKIYELFLKIMVAVIVACFIGVVISLAQNEALDWGAIFGGFVPDISTIFNPAPTYQPLLAAVDEAHRDYWSNHLVSKQQDVLISAAATAVGINMTFLFPYSLLKRGWGKEFRGLAIFDLSTGMLIPFVLATSCVVIASASQFHTVPEAGILDGTVIEGKQAGEYQTLLKNRVLAADPSLSPERVAAKVATIPPSEQRLAASLVTRDAQALSKALAPLMGAGGANLVFGFGVLAMALSTITLLMLISGFVICEMLGLPPTGWPYRLGTLASATGILWPILWQGEALFWLAITTSIVGFTLLPIAYLAFFFLMNQKKLLGDNLPTGGARIVWNLLMGVAALLATVGSVFMLWKKQQEVGIAIGIGFGVLVLLGQFYKKSTERQSEG